MAKCGGTTCAPDGHTTHLNCCKAKQYRDKDVSPYCTLPIGHEGDHIACAGYLGHDLATWPRTQEEPEMAQHKCEKKCRQTDYFDGKFAHCAEEDPDSGFICTLPQDHFGDHIACNGMEHDLTVWANKEEEKVDDTKFEITLNAFEAAVVMRLTGNILGSSKERTACGEIYKTLMKAGVKRELSKAPNTTVEFRG